MNIEFKRQPSRIFQGAASVMNRTLIIFVLALWSPPPSFAQVPHLLNYQGHLAVGDTASSGTFRMAFSIYDSQEDGDALWMEIQTVEVTDGMFNVLLGIVVPMPLSVFSEVDRYLGVKVGEGAEMVPRQRVVSVGYAFRAEVADDVPGRDIEPASVSFPDIGPIIDRQGCWVGGDVTAGSISGGVVTADSVVMSGGGVVIDGKGRWVGGDVRAGSIFGGVVTTDSLVSTGGGTVIDRQGQWVGPSPPFRLRYQTLGPKGTNESPISISANSWSDITDILTTVSVDAPSVLDIRFVGNHTAGTNCLLRIRVGGNTAVGNFSGIDNVLTAEQRHVSVNITAIVPVDPGQHLVLLQGIVKSSADGKFLSARLQNGFLEIRVFDR